MMLRFSDLSTSTSAGNSSSVNGDMRMDFNQTAYKKATIVVSGNLMQSKVYRYGVLTRNEQLAAYTYTGSIDGNVSTFSSNFSFTGNVAKLGNGTYVIKTVTPFQVTVPALNPSTGVMTVTATDNTSVRLTAIDATSVKLDVDRNGDGVYDETINTTWTDINSRS
ncbi:hypothetical protein SAMN06265795_101504 [Noviherbaspirillum humi]|uniref:Uncharacterized protein n=2 Tax=Noviherbaspirillum humi TaxID=1688639 RepID=A0A239CJP7_9BURK|nr:hypothetical protein SAMN06265795_101504 [Noviherbaspirillum humi]